MWTIVEMNVAIICTCLPQVRPLLAKLFPKLVQAYRISRGRGNGSTHSSRTAEHSVQRGEGTWRGAPDKDIAIGLTDIHHPRSDARSDECIVSGRVTPIKKTVGYSIEFSGKETTSEQPLV